MACFWCGFRARPHVGDTLLVLLVDVAVGDVLEQRLMGTPVGFQEEQLCGQNGSVLERLVRLIQRKGR